MNKPIIIDGVDVSECLAFTQEQPHLGVNCLNVLLKGGKCELNPNCYFKQLQRVKNTLKHVEKGRKIKAEKLKKVEEIVIHCIQGGFTDDFIQQIFDLCQENEDI